ncbi:helix-turn-helix domain-containing protein [Nakamurella sp. GG22]
MAESPKTGSRQFGDLLRRARERRGMSRRDVAEATELSYPYISQLETGYRQPSPAAIQSLASALHISLDEMFDAMGRRPAEANPAATASSGWTPNRNYSAGGSGAGNVRGVGAVASAPAAPVPDTMAPLPRDEAADDDGASADGVIAEVMNVLAALSPQEQLEAVAEVQARVIQAVIDEGVASRRRS